MHIGKKIKESRKKAGLTQKELAEKINRSEVSIRKYESGQREPKMDVIQAICTALNISMSDFGKELFQEYDFNTLVKESKEIELIETYLKLNGYKLTNTSIQGIASTEEEAERLAEESIKPDSPCLDITTPDNEIISLTNRDYELLFKDLKKFFEFELFKLK